MSRRRTFQDLMEERQFEDSSYRNQSPSRRRSPLFIAELTGQSEVPAVQTCARGTLRATEDQCQLHYTLSIQDITGLTQAHLHLGRPGQNGPIVAFLYELSGPTAKLDLAVRHGTIQDKDLMGPLAGKTIDDLIREIRCCNIYVNVHTQAYPNGEIRGQLLPLDADCDICRPKKCEPVKKKCPKKCKPKCPPKCECEEKKRGECEEKKEKKCGCKDHKRE